ncbi:MAG: phosphoribosyltransferase [Deltaproteobacteria bacterium]|nr:phosphoribosyltransferase [Deltaproteobacteria bacterium]
MEKEKLLEILGQAKAIIQDSHIVYTSGKHGSAYVNKDAIYPHTTLTSDLTLAMAKLFSEKQIDVVVAPVIGGVILSQWIAFHLTQLSGKEVLGVYAEKSEQAPGFELKRGYGKLVEGKNVLVVEDILNTGGSIKKVVEMLQPLNTNIVGVAAICNRGNVKAEDLGVSELKSLLDVQLDAWSEQDCPLCKNDVPINVEVGKGALYLAAKQK